MPKLSKKSKKYKELIKQIEPEKLYPLDEALDLVLKTSPTKFDATIEAHFRLKVNLSSPEQTVRGTVRLPYGTGKVPKILAIVPPEKEEEAKKAGADWTGGEALIERISKGWLEFNSVVAHPSMMGKLAKVGKILGTRKLMPNPKSGTVTENVGKTIEELKKGKAEFRMDPTGIIHFPIGKISFGKEKIKENFLELYKAIISAKPSSVKGDFIKSITLASTMGPGIKVLPSSIKI